MIVKKFSEFMLENMQDTPESYISSVLSILKKKLDKIFIQAKSVESDEILNPDELKRVKSGSMSLQDLGIQLDSSEISKYSKMYDNLVIKFSDDINAYTLIIIIDIKEVLPKNNGNNGTEEEEKDFDIDEIEMAYIKFKKYNVDTFELDGQISKNVKIKDINEEFLINLKIEIDEKFGDDDEEFEIET